MKICVIGNFFIFFHKYAFEEFGIEYDVYDGFDAEICKQINKAEYDLVLITNAWGPVLYPYDRIKHRTAFWTSEDPNHFDKLKSHAIQCDHIFTTAEECVAKYMKLQGRHKTVSVLQFAMAPEIHTAPDSDKPKKFDVLFIGNRYTDCKVRIDGEKAILLPVLKSNYGLHVCGHWDNQYGWKGHIPDANFHGWVPCDRVAPWYNQAHVALSMNEQTESETMTSMRVFDVVGCATPMLSYKSKATQNLFGDYVNFATNPEETIAFLDKYFTNPKPYIEKANAGREYALQHHTYQHRIRELLDTVL